MAMKKQIRWLSTFAEFKELKRGPRKLSVRCPTRNHFTDDDEGDAFEFCEAGTAKISCLGFHMLHFVVTDVWSTVISLLRH